MDPLFERRNLTKRVHIHSKFLQQNMQRPILEQLQRDYEGRCAAEGFIGRSSITVVSYSCGRIRYTNDKDSGADYEVEFQADVCFPHPGQRLRAPVTLRSKVGIHAETAPIKVLIPRDLHIGQEEFERVEVGDDIEFEVVGHKFKQQDDDIIVVGRLLSKVEPEVERPLNSAPAAQEVFIPTSDNAEESEEKHITIHAVADSDKPKKRKLRRSEGGQVNEHFQSLKEGMD